MHDAIDSRKQFTDERLVKMRAILADLLPRNSFVVVANGSYARGEASNESDLDYFLICNSKKDIPRVKKELPRISRGLTKVVPKRYSASGAFGKIESIEEMILNIGGNLDGNEKITRRVLFLLEGEWLHNKEGFHEYRKKIIEKYVKKTISDHQFCRFLLNDLIRYYRTICVDFEHKTTELGKAWGVRNIKLVFSRKLLYFSGILIAAETWQHTYSTKCEKLHFLLGLTPIERVKIVCGDRATSAIAAYGEFLKKLADPSIRRILEKEPFLREKQSQEFRLFKNEGHHFSWLLAKLLSDTYDDSHPIHNALIV